MQQEGLWNTTMLTTPTNRTGKWPYVNLHQLTRRGKPCIAGMTEDTLDLLNTMCRAAESRHGWLHRINSSWRPTDTQGQHPLGRAIDIVFYTVQPGDLDVWTQYQFARTFPWGGIGAYPFWNAPGIHCDTRQDLDHIATWWRDATLHYRGLAEARTIFGITV